MIIYDMPIDSDRQLLSARSCRNICEPSFGDLIRIIPKVTVS